MRIKLTNLLLMMLLVMVSKSQIYLNNLTKEPVSVAVAIYYDTKEFKGWISQGWAIINPNETKPLNSGGSGTNDVFYYYAISNSGKEYIQESNEKKMAVSKSGFSIKNCDLGYVLNENSGYYLKQFRKVQMNASKFQSKYTITLRF